MKRYIITTLLLSLSASANTIYVNQHNTSKEPNGTSWKSAYKSLNKALKTAKKGDDIWVAKGEYILKATRLDGINIYGGFRATETELSARDIVNNETKIFGRLALQNALVSSVTILQQPENHNVVNLDFNTNRKTTPFIPNQQKLNDARARRLQKARFYDTQHPEAENAQETPPYTQPLHQVASSQITPPSQERSRRGPPPPDEIFQRFDANSDGKISKDEAPQKMKRDWNRLDENKDGFIQKDELKPPQQNAQRSPFQERR
ncbi:MAG TPA: hypothetical protein ENK65_00705 [Helicobacteraceae bacterium]|nr:hypothetical protein [Helicobacteraceae bacterium]